MNPFHYYCCNICTVGKVITKTNDQNYQTRAHYSRGLVISTYYCNIFLKGKRTSKRKNWQQATTTVKTLADLLSYYKVNSLEMKVND